MKSDNLKKLRLFIASPSDMINERARLLVVVEDLKVLAEYVGVTLELIDWRQVIPDLGRPEQIILDQLQPDNWDVFIGILWHRFGTPPQMIDPETGKEYLSGTEEEFRGAYRLWRKYRRPRVMFYWCKRNPPWDDLDPVQFQRVKDFFAAFASTADHPGLYQTFDSLESFERLARKNLTDFLIQYSEQVKDRSVSLQEVQLFIPSMPDMLPRRAVFFGREKEMDKVLRALSPEERGWGVVIEGIGGIGKTALAVEAAYRCKEQGLFEAFIFVTAKQKRLEPSGIKSETRVATTLDEFINETARALGKPNIAKLASAHKIRTLFDALQQTRALLIYDNLEMLTKEEQEALAGWLRSLPSSCKAILTSRRRGGEGALWLRLESLDWETAHAIIQHESDREAHLKETFQLAGEARWRELHEETGGSPLALIWTLGLMRTRGLSFDRAMEILRQGTSVKSPLQKFIYREARKELSAGDVAALNALSFFVPSATFDAWMQVANLSHSALETTIDRLTALSLVDVLAGEERYALNPLTRAFVRDELLADANIAHETGIRFARYWVEYARKYSSEENKSYKMYDRLEAEWPNLDAAIELLWNKIQIQEDVTRTNNHAQELNSLADTLTQFLWFNGHWDELAQLNKRAYEAIRGQNSSLEGRRTYNVALICYYRSNIDEAVYFARLCDESWKHSVSKYEQAKSARLRGLIAEMQEDYATAELCFQKALALYRAEGLEIEIAGVSDNLGTVAYHIGKTEVAEKYYREALASAERIGAEETEAKILINLGNIALDRSQWVQAQKLYERALDLAKHVRRQDAIAEALLGLALLWEAEEREDLALPLAQEALSIFERLQDRNLAKIQELLERIRNPNIRIESFFLRAGFEDIDYLPNNIVGLRPKAWQSAAAATLWSGLSSQTLQQIANTIASYKLKQNELSKFYLVYKSRMPSADVIHFLRGSTKSIVVPLQWSFLQKMLAKPNVEQELKELEEPYVVRSDPYFESKPINDPNWFYGRSDMLNRLPAVLTNGQHVGIFGLRKIGKTSLINQLRQKYLITPTILVDCQAFQAKTGNHYREIVIQLNAELDSKGIRNLPSLRNNVKEETFRQIFLDLFNRWQESGGRTRFVIIFDEVDKLFPDRDIKRNEKVLREYVKLFRVLRGLAQRHKCLVTMVVAYRPDINRQNVITRAIGDNPMFHSFREEYLGFLSDRDSEVMIREIGSWKEIRWDTDAAQRVFYYCGGHPLVTRIFASQTSKEGDLKNIDYLRVEETARDIEQCFRRNEIGNYYKEGIWDALREDEQELLRSIVQKDDRNLPESEVPKNLEEALTNIENFGLVTNANGVLGVSACLFANWLIRRLAP